jgi:hypothetical protein
MRTSAGSSALQHSTTCPRGTLLGFQPGALLILPAGCHKWHCANCGRKNARKLAARIIHTKARRFITLTVRACRPTDARDQLDLMNHAWRLLWKRIKRKQGASAVGYVKVVELTKKGTPHFHVAIDTAFISQRWLSLQWLELTGSPVVDIRLIRSESGLAHYLAKYLTKRSETVSKRRKFSASRGFLPPPTKAAVDPDEIPPSWSFTPGDHAILEAALIAQGWARIGNWFISPSEPAAPS